MLLLGGRGGGREGGMESSIFLVCGVSALCFTMFSPEVVAGQIYFAIPIRRAFGGLFGA